jgi:tetratricopeptide (TPR) repeat protein
VACYLSHYFWVVGELDAAMEASQRALTIASAIGDGLLAAETELYQGVVFTAQGDNEGAWQMLERAQSKLDPSAVGRPGAANRSTVLWLLVRCFLTRALAELGRFEEGIAAGEEALVVAERNSTAFGLATALAGLGSLYLRKAEPETAIPLLERGLEVSQTYSVNNWLPTIGASLGSAYALVGRVDESLRLLEEAVRLNCAMGLVATVSLWRMYLGEAQLRAGKVAESVAMARQILADCRARGEHGYEAWALHLLGVASASTGDAGEARTRCFEALQLAERLGMRPLVVRCLLVLARLHERDIAAATDYRTRAGRLAAEQGMSLTLLESV